MASTDAIASANAGRLFVVGVPATSMFSLIVNGTPCNALAGPSAARRRSASAAAASARSSMRRTNLPDLGLRVATESSLHGITKNPWHPSATAGGSSGGEGSALASGMSPIGLGNDIGGSLRNPAHCCGIASIKPSTGVVPAVSVIPPEDMALMFQLMAVEGVMARHVADVLSLIHISEPTRPY